LSVVILDEINVRDSGNLTYRRIILIRQSNFEGPWRAKDGRHDFARNLALQRAVCYLVHVLVHVHLPR